MLRERAGVRGPVIRLGDVADIAADDPAELDELATTPLMPSPADGAEELLTVRQIRDVLAARGVDLGRLNFLGSDAVTVGELAADEGVAGQASEIPTAGKKLSTGAAAERATAMIREFLRRETGHQDWNIQVDASEALATALAATPGVISVRGGKAPWSGRQRFELIAAGQSPASVIARVERVSLVVFAVRAIERGALVGAADVELRPYAGELPTKAIFILGEAIGKEAVQGLRPDAVVVANQLRLPVVVRRGEQVEVRARATGVTVKTFATATQDGSVGDLMIVEGLTGKDRFAARVTGPRQLEVFAAGTALGDFSTQTR